MEALDLARWQFGITTVYHFLQVPLTIGMAFLVAVMQTKAYKGGPNAKAWDKLAQFFGKLLVINFALGAATGIVQEFQFGMNWSEYARYMGDIFGAPLAFEALLSFFLESTFVGIWIFGRGRISPKAHLASIWCFSAGTFTSALWIIAANSFMQDPHGAVVDPETGRAVLENKAAFLSVLFNKTSMLAFAHTISAAFMVSATMIVSLSMWWMAKSVKAGRTEEAETYWRPAAKFGLVWLIVGSLAGILTGHFIGQHVGDIQPQKSAAMMGICETGEGQNFTLLRWGDCENGGELAVPIPGLESFMATNHFSGPDSTLVSLDDVNAELQAKYSDPATYDEASKPSDEMLQTYAEQDYKPNMAVTYYSFRIMMALGFVLLIAAIAGLAFLRGGKLYDPKGKGSWWNWLIPLPFLASMFGWIMTEMGRQPFIVNPSLSEAGGGSNVVMLLTDYGLSGSVQMQSVLISLIAFTAIYTFLGVIWVVLLRRYAIEGINPEAKVIEYDESAEAPITFMY